LEVSIFHISKEKSSFGPPWDIRDGIYRGELLKNARPSNAISADTFSVVCPTRVCY
jgi:hypothetical protein